ncbi:MAG: right-handed parallel beta-helix repeat-containing protein [Methanomassiliicoccales archaeon]|nr:right-handed parallel beta-helix repeat-containing protein [Methanomassiliicoccales archaeon]
MEKTFGKRTCLFLVIMIATSYIAIGPTGTVNAEVLGSHGVIAIVGNAELISLATSEGWEGNGSVDDPFIITGYDINATGVDSGILVQDTTLHLIVQDCNVYSALLRGILLDNVKNVTLNNNTCSGNGHEGIDLVDSSSNIVTNNTCDDINYGIYLLNSNNNIISHNTCPSNNYGIFLWVASYNIISHNVCSSNGNAGIFYFMDSYYNVVSDNVCTSNGRGIAFMDTCLQNVIENNTLDQNVGYGIWMGDSCANNMICGNVFMHNNGATYTYNATNIQAYSMYPNFWNTGAYGNFWSDWAAPDMDRDGIVDVAYAVNDWIRDEHPLTTPSLPGVTISTPENGTITMGSTVTIEGTANPAYDLDVNGVLVNVRNDWNFSVVISLVEGTNVVTATSGCTAFNVSDNISITYINGLQIAIDALTARLAECYDAQNQTADEVASLLENVSAMKTSLMKLSDSLNSTDANDTEMLGHLNDVINDLNATEGVLTDLLTEMQGEIDDANERIGEVYDALNATSSWLLSVSDRLAACYDAQNATADEVGSMLANITVMKTSLIQLRSSMNSTDANVTALIEYLDGAIADLSDIEANLTLVRSNLTATDDDVTGLKNDQLPLILGAAGLLLGIIAVILVIVRSKRP